MRSGPVRIAQGPTPPPDPQVIDSTADRILAQCDEMHAMSATLALGAALARLCVGSCEGDRVAAATFAHNAVDAGLNYEKIDAGILPDSPMKGPSHAE